VPRVDFASLMLSPSLATQSSHLSHRARILSRQMRRRRPPTTYHPAALSFPPWFAFSFRRAGSPFPRSLRTTVSYRALMPLQSLACSPYRCRPFESVPPP
jgi:hypothetical protein